MDKMGHIGKILILVGIIILILGVLITYGDNIPIISKFGRLPGDITIEKDGFVIYFPLASSLLISAIIYLIFKVFQR